MTTQHKGDQIIMLGTGHATVTHCYNTCFLLKWAGGSMLVDAGGGNGILSQLEKSGTSLSDIRNMFITHAHTDHILGAVWVVRMVIQLMRRGTYHGNFTIFGHDKALTTLHTICSLTLAAGYKSYIGERVLFREVKEGDTIDLDGGTTIRCFDIHSTKEKQFGFRATLPDGVEVVCLGDEPYNEANRQQATDADWLLCEAFCLYADWEKFKPYEKHHSTALDAGKMAHSLNTRNLLLYHTEDTTLSTRKHSYTAEAAINFTGGIYVPDDLEVIDISASR